MPTPEDNPRGTPLNASPSPVTPPSPPLCLVIDYRGGFVPVGEGEGTLPTCLLPVGHDGPHSWQNESEPLEDDDDLPGRWYARLIISWPRAGIDPLPILTQISSWALLDDPAVEVDFNLTWDGLS